MRTDGIRSMSGISVVMCTFNGEPYIRQQMESIFAQTLAPLEIIVSDDGSADRTLEIIQSMAGETEIPIRVYRNSGRLGFADNFLQACDHANGQYIAFSDQDDKWSPRKLEMSAGALESNGARLCVHRVHKINSQGERIPGPPQVLPQTGVVEPLRSHPWGNFLGFTMLFERSLLDYFPRGSRGRDPHSRDSPLSHDRWVYFLAATFGRIFVLDESLAEYRQHDGQLYGGTKDRSIAERVTTKLASGREQALYLADLAAHRASLLESLVPAGQLPSDQPTPESAGANWWRTIELHLNGSSGLYLGRRTAHRFALLLRNILSGSYRSFRHGGLGRGRFVEDVVVVGLMGLPRDVDRLIIGPKQLLRSAQAGWDKR